MVKSMSVTKNRNPDFIGCYLFTPKDNRKFSEVFFQLFINQRTPEEDFNKISGTYMHRSTNRLSTFTGFINDTFIEFTVPLIFPNEVSKSHFYSAIQKNKDDIYDGKFSLVCSKSFKEISDPLPFTLYTPESLFYNARN